MCTSIIVAVAVAVAVTITVSAVKAVHCNIRAENPSKSISTYQPLHAIAPVLQETAFINSFAEDFTLLC